MLMKRITAVFMAMLISLSGIEVFAFSDVENVGEGKSFYINGTAETANANVTLILTRLGVTLEECQSDPSRILYAKQVKCDKNANFSIPVALDIDEDTEVQAYLNVKGGTVYDGLSFTVKNEKIIQETDGFSVKRSGTRLYISGYSKAKLKNKTVTITVTSSDTGLNNITKEDIAAFRQVKTDNDGFFSVTLDLNTDLYSTGYYDVRVREKDYDIETATVRLYGAEIFENVLEGVNNGADLKTVLSDNADALCDDFERFNQYLDLICAKISGAVYSDINDLMDDIERVYASSTGETEAIWAINDAARTGNWAKIEEYITAIKSTKDLFLKMTGRSYKNAEEIRAAFDDAYNKTLAAQTTGTGTSAGGQSSGISSIGISKPIYQASTPSVRAEGFTDMSDAEWARTAVEYFAKMGYVSGYDDNSFNPNANITREEFLTILINAFGYELVSDAQGFTDTDPAAWYCPYVSSGRYYGITAGKDDGSFGIGENITRADMAVMAHRAYSAKMGELKIVRAAAVFDDFYLISEYAVNSVTAMQQSGAINGKGNNLFCPLDFASRAEVVQMLYTMLDVQRREITVNSLLGESETGLLAALGIIDEECNMANGFTRADMARAVAALNPNIPPANQTFNDVSVSDRIYSSVSVACVTGCMTDDEGSFYPQNPVTAAEFVPFLVSFAGYADIAEFNGGDFNAYSKALYYMDAAVAMEEDEKLNFNKAAYCIYHMLMSNPMVWTGNMSDSSITKDTGTTIFKEVYDLHEGEGIVEGIYKTTLTHPDNSIGENDVIIDGARYYYENGREFFGYYTKFYYNEDDEIVYIAKNEKRNSVMTIDSTDLIKFENNTLTYSDENDRTRTVNFRKRPDLVYNSAAYPTYGDDEVIPHSGRIELIDFDGDRVYDLIKVYEYEYIVAGEIDAKNMVVYDKFDSKLSVLLDDNLADITILKKGKVITPQQIVEGNLLAVQKSKADGEPTIYVEVSGTCVTGYVTGYSEDEYIMIDNKPYTVDGRLKKMIENGEFVIRSRNSAFVWLFNDRAVMADYESDSNGGVAFLMKATHIDEDDRVYIKVFTVGKEEKEFYCAENTIVDGVRCSDSKSIIAAIRQGNIAAGVSAVASDTAQPILYQLNADNEINNIDTAFLGESEGKNSFFMNADHNTETWRYLSSNKSFYTTSDNKLVTSVKPDTVAFFVPQNDVTSKTNYNVTSSGNLLANNARYTVRAFGNSDNFTSDYLFVYSNVATSIPQSAVPVPVKALRTAENADGDLVTYLDVYVDGNLRSLQIEDNVKIPDIKQGDLVRYRTNSRTGDIMVLTKVFDINEVPDADARIQSDNSTLTSETNSYNYTYRLIYGTLWAKDSNIITVTTGIDDDAGIEAGDYIDNFYLGSQTVYVYDPYGGSDKLSVGSVYDLLSYKTAGNDASRVIIYTNNGTLKMIYKIAGED